MPAVSKQFFRVHTHLDPAETSHLVEVCSYGGQVERATLEHFEVGRQFIEAVDSIGDDTTASWTISEGARSFDSRAILWSIADVLGVADQVESVTQGDNRPAKIADALIAIL